MVQQALDHRQRAPPVSLLAMLRAVDDVLAREREEGRHRLRRATLELRERYVGG